MIHELKTWPEYFELVLTGEKLVEVRRDDRNYAVKDILILQEWDPRTQVYTGRKCTVRVTHILRGAPWLAEGYVALSIQTGRSLARELLVSSVEKFFNADAWSQLENNPSFQKTKSELELILNLAHKDVESIDIEEMISVDRNKTNTILVDISRFQAMEAIVKAAQAWRRGMVDRAGFSKTKQEARARHQDNVQIAFKLTQAVDEWDKLVQMEQPSLLDETGEMSG